MVERTHDILEYRTLIEHSDTTYKHLTFILITEYWPDIIINDVILYIKLTRLFPNYN